MMLNYRGTEWDYIQLDDGDRHACAENIILAISDAWHRLVCLHERDPRYQLLRVCDIKNYSDYTIGI
eukprot:5630043-Pyramimonas_sp.AAC.1